MTKFTDLNLSPKILQAIEDVGYDTPTPIQEQAIPFALEGRDVLGIAQTGTGKTAGFTLPMIQKLARGRGRARMPRSLVLTPTRELAAQVSENFELYAKYVKLDMALLIGGVSFREQGRLLDKGVDVLIATPGRLLDHVGRGKLLLSGIEIMVVDEADRMLDMGFIPDIEKIFKLTPFTRQTLFFSATMAPEIARITKEFLQNPAKVEVKREEMTSNLITQRVCDLPTNVKRSNSPVKRSVLRALIAHESHQLTNAIVFCNRKSEVDTLLKSFKKHGISAGAIHGGLDQKHRLRVLKSFKNNEITFLLASDVAARGLDIPMVSHVFNYDIPTHPEDYIHRIGRTGRAGRSGFSFSLCAEADHKYLAAIEKLMGSRILSIELDDFGFEAEAEDKPKSRTTQRDAGAGAGAVVLGVIKNAKVRVVADGAIAVVVRLAVQTPTLNRVKTAVRIAARIAVKNVVRGVIGNAVKVVMKPVVKTVMKTVVRIVVRIVMKNAPNRAKKPATRVVKITVMRDAIPIVIPIAMRPLTKAIGATADKAKAKLRVWANISQVF